MIYIKMMREIIKFSVLRVEDQDTTEHFNNLAHSAHEDKHEELQNRSFVNFNAKYFNREVSPFQVFTESFK